MRPLPNTLAQRWRQFREKKREEPSPRNMLTSFVFSLQITIDLCMAAVDGKVVGEYVKQTPKKTIVLVAPPFYLSTPFLQSCEKIAAVLTMRELIQKPSIETAKNTLIWLYEVPDAGKLEIKGENTALIVAGYWNDHGTKLTYLKFFEVVL